MKATSHKFLINTKTMLTVWLMTILVFVLILKFGITSSSERLVWILAVDVLVGIASFVFAMLSFILDRISKKKDRGTRRTFSFWFPFAFGSLFVLGLLLLFWTYGVFSQQPSPGAQQITKTEENGFAEVLCGRDRPSPMLPEFARALSLIQQRMPVNVAYGVSNCLEIKYATSDSEIEDAEGVFVFDPVKSSEDKLTIFVSPRYKSQSDILTALLLAHESSHAFRYAGVQSGNIKSDKTQAEFCYEDEALAFTNQIIFLAGLNEGEKESLISMVESQRQFFSNSQEVSFLKNYLIASGEGLGRCAGTDFGKTFSCMKDYWLEVVKTTPSYQKQCEGRGMK